VAARFALPRLCSYTHVWHHTATTSRGCICNCHRSVLSSFDGDDGGGGGVGSGGDGGGCEVAMALLDDATADLGRPPDIEVRQLLGTFKNE
jgi:hypothetical protein